MAYNSKCVNELIAELVEELGLNDQRMRPIMLTWIFDAQSDIGASELQEQETAWLPFNNFVIPKPKDFFWARQILLKGEQNGVGGCITPRLEARYRCNCPCDNYDSGCDVTMVEYDTYYGVSTNAKNYDAYKILYVSIPVSEAGYPMIPLSSVKAVKQYVLFKFLKRQRRSFPDKVPMSEIKDEQRLWQQYRDQAWARQMTPDDPAMRTIAMAYWRSGITLQDMSYGYRYYANQYGFMPA